MSELRNVHRQIMRVAEKLSSALPRSTEFLDNIRDSLRLLAESHFDNRIEVARMLDTIEKSE
jgi:hypothetical protein